jgi:hypothetical protein
MGSEVLWTRINRDLAPEAMRDRFEQYIATAVTGELQNAPEVFAPSRWNGFWVVLRITATDAPRP